MNKLIESLKSAIIFGFLICGVTGCTTTKHVASIGECILDGSPGMALIDTITLPVVAMVDVATLGMMDYGPRHCSKQKETSAEAEARINRNNNILSASTSAINSAAITAASGTGAARNVGSSYSNALIASNSLVAIAGGGEIQHSSSYNSSTSMASQAIAGPSGAGASIGGSCHSDLSYLSSRIPSFSQNILENVRGSILTTVLSDTMRAASQQGYSPESAIQSSLEQARAYDETVRQALSTAAATDGFGTTDDEFLDSLKRGTLSVSTCEGIRNAALCDAINNKLGAVASRALAADMQCHFRAGTWAR